MQSYEDFVGCFKYILVLYRARCRDEAGGKKNVMMIVTSTNSTLQNNTTYFQSVLLESISSFASLFSKIIIRMN